MLLAISQLFHPHTPFPKNPNTSHLSKGGGTRVRVQLLARVGGAVGQGELEVLGEELLDVGAADAVDIGNLNNLKDLHSRMVSIWCWNCEKSKRTWMEPKRAR